MKHFILGFAILFLAACQSHDKNYYLVHPNELNEALKMCPNEHPAKVSCDELNAITNEVNQLAWELQSNQQEFGQQIISLQTHLANLENILRTNPNQADIVKKIREIQKQLSMRLAIVKWLQSPESRE